MALFVCIVGENVFEECLLALRGSLDEDNAYVAPNIRFSAIRLYESNEMLFVKKFENDTFQFLEGEELDGKQRSHLF